MRCPECNAKWKWRRDYKKNKCHKCGRKHKMTDFLSKEFLEELRSEE